MTHRTTVYQAIRAHVSGSYTTGTLHGKEYIVVPVVALVEGILQGMAAEGPELALASEFGKFPDSWNGRPVVMSHPVIEVDGKKIPVSANSPEVLESYQIGFIFNTKLDGNKLTQEAWIDPDIMGSLNDHSKEILEILQKGEMIEVSTGYFATLEKTEGLFNNEAFEAIQRNVAPDHLAFLANGVLGACSNKDGCGAQLAANAKPSDNFDAVKTFYAVQPCCDKCAAHEPCEADQMSQNANPNTPSKEKENPAIYKALTFSHTVADGVTFEDARTAVRDALNSNGTSHTYVVALTKNKVVYERYNSFTGNYECYQQSYSVSADGKVTLSDDIEKVRLMTKIVAANEDPSGAEPQDNPEKDMTTQTEKTAPAAEPKVHKVENETGSLEVTMNEAGDAPVSFKFQPKANAAPTPQTPEEYIAQAPKAMQSVLSQALAAHTSKHAELVAQVKGLSTNRFTEEQLTGFDIPMLENLAALGNAPSFAGRAAPVSNSASDEGSYSPAPSIFEVGEKKAAAAA